MKTLMSIRALRVTAIVLSAVFVLLAFVSFFVSIEMINANFYDPNTKLNELKYSAVWQAAYGYAAGIYNRYEWYDPQEDLNYIEYMNDYAEMYELYYCLYLDSDNLIASNTMGDIKFEYALEYSFVTEPNIHSPSYSEDYVMDYGATHSNPAVITGATYTLVLCIKSDREYIDEIYYTDKYFDGLYTARSVYPVLCLVFGVLSVLTYVFAVCGAGRRRFKSTFTPTFFDKIPFDVLCVCELFFVSLLAYFVDSWSGDDIAFAIAMGISMFIGSVSLTLLSMTFVLRVRLGTLWKNNASVKLVSAAWRFAVKFIRAVPLFWRTLLFILTVAFMNFMSFILWTDSDFALPFVLLWLALIAISCFAAYNMSRLKSGAARIASGELDYKIPEENLLFDFKRHAENLNSIGGGMAAAVEERMKGERFKTELITNVSHDIKTPVTSIINYVDLLDKCELESETAREYVAVLRRQSERLKKLTEDIVDASKASSGVLTVDIKPLDLGILLSQAAGEYGERFEAAGLSLVCRMPEIPVNVLADGKHVFRIFDNLLGNALKYSLSGTRVHLSLTERDGHAVASVSNVSREPLPEDGSELTERFVRGDTSRHTEGSGLGLSIAKSLADLQGASLSVKTDGDYFKATLKIKTVGADLRKNAKIIENNCEQSIDTTPSLW